MVFLSMSNGINHYVRKPSTYFLTSFLPHFLHFSLSFFPLSFASFPSLPSLKSHCPLPLSFCLSHSFFLPFIHSSNIYLVVYQVFPWVIVAAIWSESNYSLSQILMTEFKYKASWQAILRMVSSRNLIQSFCKARVMPSSTVPFSM